MHDETPAASALRRFVEERFAAFRSTDMRTVQDMVEDALSEAYQRGRDAAHLEVLEY